ncbi:MAG: DEAD/DEAH box helicase family protein [Bdellovibrionota bacterium]
MPSNFDFLPQQWSKLKEDAWHAESTALTQPRTSAFYARRALEKTVKWLYDFDRTLKRPYQDNLSALIHEPTFQKLIAPSGLFQYIRLIHKIGNQAAHSDVQIRQYDGIEIVKSLHGVLSWAVRIYTKTDYKTPFDAALIPKPEASALQESKRTIAELQAKLQGEDQRYENERKERLKNEGEIERLRQEIESLKKQNTERVKTTPEIITEADTRKWLIDVMLRESGWDKFAEGRDVEYLVKGMPNPTGEGYVDYVLWGDDGLPLGIVEAKRTSKDPIEGQRQAELYATCLEKETGQRPIIYYTNGYEIWLWDDKFYPPRNVQGYATKDELQLLINRRKDRLPLAGAEPKTDIIDRYYQIEAATRVKERFENERQRQSLLVMATGTGKTRMSIALVELLMRQNWVKRVLFLADRTALVRQAKKRFTELLPNVGSVNIVSETEEENTRLVFSTYHSMMNLIDDSRSDGKKRFGTNYFDLIIIDEAHRSVYHKFKAIFEYFDSLLIGLTATPRSEVGKDTYALFHCENNVPTSWYELDKAIEDKFLVPPVPVSVPTKFHREGIKYDDLSEEEQEEYEETFFDDETGSMPKEIEPGALNSWLFNKDTVDKVLAHLMQNGIKIEGGDKLGKSIIFAKNHNHAVFIEERFNRNYPHLAGKFLRVIDNQIKYADTLIDEFDVADKDPFIAVSVDMLDTGIDIEEIVNLVFFKVVRSRTKFWQMIGRGTRLCPNLFGPDQDKQNFYIFDYCQNFEFFGKNPKGVETQPQESVKEKIFKRRLQIIRYLESDPKKSEEAAALVQELKDSLHEQLLSVNVDSFVVRPHRKYVQKFLDRASWDSLSPTDYHDIAMHLSGLPYPDDDDEFARRFDLLVLNLSVSILEASPKQAGYQSSIISLATSLEKKRNIPSVAAKIDLIRLVQTDDYWQNITVPLLDEMREELRELIKFIDAESGLSRVYTNFEDEIGEGMIVSEFMPTYGDVTQYKLKVERFVRDHKNHITIARLMNNLPISTTDLAGLEEILFTQDAAGTREQFEKIYGKQPLGRFIRSLVGLDRNAAKEAFAAFLSSGSLTADQITFINQIIEHLVKNGVMSPDKLFDQPFTDQSTDGVIGVFPEQAEQIIQLIERINLNAEAA